MKTLQNRTDGDREYRGQYRYRIYSLSVYDGDTLRADIDLGFGTWLHGVKLRLARIDAPEMRRPDLAKARTARDTLRKLTDDVQLEAWTIGRGSYNRWIVELWAWETTTGEWINLNDELVRLGVVAYR